MSAPHLDSETLKRILVYDPRSGFFTWKHRTDVPKGWNTRYAGKVAGYRGSTSPGTEYWFIRLFNWPFRAHRLAWLYMVGEWPEDCIDHRDLNGLNNRWDNLRPATRIQNGANTRAKRSNTTGFKGVSLIKSSGRYRATIQQNGVWRQLGVFQTPEDAHAAYVEAASKLFGSFARVA